MNTTLKPKCLTWARERAGLSVEDLARKVNVKPERVTAWEQSGEITVSQAQKVADATYVPFGYLFLSEPPVEELPIQDFRTVGSTRLRKPSPELMDTLNEALRRQDWYRDYLINAGDDPLPFVGSLTVNDDAVKAAESIRQVVDWGANIRSESTNWENALARQKDAVEKAGILVMQSGIVGHNTSRPLDVGEFRGFALSDKYAPLVFLNSKDTKAAKMFTLAHEIVHIFLGESGVSNLTQTMTMASPNFESVEEFCNKVAAELLVPLAELKSQWEALAARRDRVRRVSRHFKVSTLVILRRINDAGYVSRDEFNRLYADELSVLEPSSSDGEGGGNYYYTLRSRLGKRFASALIESTLQGGTLYRDAFNLLGMKDSKVFNKFANMITETTA